MRIAERNVEKVEYVRETGTWWGAFKSMFKKSPKDISERELEHEEAKTREKLTEA